MTTYKMWRSSAMASMVVVVGGMAPAHETAIDPALLMVQSGDCPIVISAPHGGSKPIPGVPPRHGKDARKFVTVRDDGTEVLAHLLADRLEKKLGRKPHLVVAYFHRKCVDVNRPGNDAFESDLAKPYYDAYHQALAAAHAAVVKRYGRGILIDLHGQAADKDAIFRGTNNLKSVTHLVNRSGKGALLGKGGLLGELGLRNRTLIPANDSDSTEDPRFAGGYITQTYGSRQGGTVDAVQLELGSSLRRAPGRDEFANDLAEALAAFSARYLPGKD
jgi:N-formylglutamate amidohydrolase